MKILIITENESSDFVRIITRHKCVPFIRRTILSGLDIIKHYKPDAVVIDKDTNLDPLEFLLNANDLKSGLPYFVHYNLTSRKDWIKANNLGLHIERIVPDAFENRLLEIKKTVEGK